MCVYLYMCVFAGHYVVTHSFISWLIFGVCSPPGAGINAYVHIDLNIVFFSFLRFILFIWLVRVRV